jgi:hypothetical protein
VEFPRRKDTKISKFLAPGPPNEKQGTTKSAIDIKGSIFYGINVETLQLVEHNYINLQDATIEHDLDCCSRLEQD